MKMAEILKKAKALGIKTTKIMTKVDVVRAIQTTEGFTPCFSSGVTECPYTECCFREDCLD